MGNIAFNRPASASSFVMPYAASRAVDGQYGPTTPTSRWLCNTVPAWLSVDLGATSWVNRWVVRHMPIAGWRTPDYVLSDFKLQGSNNNVNWYDIDGVLGNTSAITDRTTTAVSYRYFRVYVTKGLKTNLLMASIMEFELYPAPPTSPYLSNLIPSTGALNPVFNKTTTAYTATVDNSVSAITLTPTAEDTNATIKVNEVVVRSGMASQPVNLNVGSNTITVNVTSQIGGLVQNYTVTVTRLDSNYLSNLAAQSGTTDIPLNPSFSKATGAYTASVANNVSSMTVTPTAESTGASITVNGTTVQSGQVSQAINLNVGINTITIVVTASGQPRTYTLAVTRLDSNYLGNLTAQSGTTDIPLNPSFSQATGAYTASVANNVSSMTVTPTAESAGASITVNGTTVPSGQVSQAINLNVGINTITIVVTASGQPRTYTLAVTRADSSYLSALAVQSGTTPIALSPTPFVKTTFGYSATVGFDISGVTVTPTAESASATITVNGAPVVSGQPSASIPLSIGLNTIPVVVNAGGVTQNYSIAITRVDTSLAGLVLKGIPGNTAIMLTPGFQSATLVYTANSGGKSSVSFTPTASATGSTITVGGTPVNSGSSVTKSVVSGPNQILIVVTNSGVSTTYQVTVTR